MVWRRWRRLTPAANVANQAFQIHKAVSVLAFSTLAFRKSLQVQTIPTKALAALRKNVTRIVISRQSPPSMRVKMPQSSKCQLSHSSSSRGRKHMLLRLGWFPLFDRTSFTLGWRSDPLRLHRQSDGGGEQWEMLNRRTVDKDVWICEAQISTLTFFWIVFSKSHLLYAHLLVCALRTFVFESCIFRKQQHTWAGHHYVYDVFFFSLTFLLQYFNLEKVEVTRCGDQQPSETVH